jgi:hypothetical protein
MKSTLSLVFLAALIKPAAAHHLEDYDARIRAEAHLPGEWFACKSADDCTLVSVPCRSDLAVSAAHREAARDALVDAIPFCLGSSLNDTEAACEKRQCVTLPAKKD